MYVPASFAETDLETLQAAIERYSFATLISQQGCEPFASHLPLLLDRGHGSQGRLIGHMARANGQWRTAGGQSVLAIFHGPHAYVSPTWYEARDVVPTWNYVAVHVYGVLRVIDDADQLREIVRQTVDLYEGSQPRPWSSESPSPEFVDQLLKAIVGFEIDIERIEGKWKLSQNHPLERREKVIAALRSKGRPDDAEIARLMAERC